MSQSVTITSHNVNTNDNITPIARSNASNNNAGRQLVTTKKPNVYQYSHSNITVDLNNVTQFTTDLTDPEVIFDETTMFHYCNLILDKYNTGEMSVGMFQNGLTSDDFPENVAVYFHPFQWKNEWHLAIGFTKYSKILFVHCSDFTATSTNSFPSFSRKTSIKIQQFILFFKQKLSTNALKFPRLYTDLYEPVTSNNAVNLLTIIFSFCLDPVSLVRSFCDPEFSPRKFEISDIYPILQRIDIDLREQLQWQRDAILKLEAERLERIKLEENIRKETALKLEQERKEIEREERERKEKERIEKERVEKEKKQKELEMIALKKKEEERKAEEKKRQEIERKELLDKEIKEQLKRAREAAELKIAELEKQNKLKLDAEAEIKRLKEEADKRRSIKEKAILETIKREKEEKARKEETARKAEEVLSNTESSLEPEPKKQKIAEHSNSAVVEINDLESSDEDVDMHNNVVTENPLERKLKLENMYATQTLQKTPKEEANPDKKSDKENIENLFLSKYAKEFYSHIHNSTALHEDLNLDIMFELIQKVSLNPLTHPDIFEDPIRGERFMSNTFKLRNCLNATYKKGSRLEFDEDQFSKMLEEDYKNQIIPLVFINDSIFLINIKTSDNFNCIVRIFCISNRTNRSEREVMKSYALRRLIEMYVAKYHRLVTKIKLCMVPVKNMEVYKVLMQTIIVMHKVFWRNKYDMNMKLSADELDNYILFFENIMDQIGKRDFFKVELNFKRLVKHVLSK